MLSTKMIPARPALLHRHHQVNQTTCHPNRTQMILQATHPVARHPPAALRRRHHHHPILATHPIPAAQAQANRLTVAKNTTNQNQP